MTSKGRAAGNAGLDGRSRAGACLLATLLVALSTGCGAVTSVRTIAPLEPAREASWFLTFRYDPDRATIEDVPRDDGGRGGFVWSSRRELELHLLEELAYLLSVEHGVPLVDAREDATGLLSVAIQVTTGGRGLFEMGDWARRVDVYVTDLRGETTYAQVTVEDNAWDRQSPEELAGAAARLLADLLSDH